MFLRDMFFLILRVAGDLDHFHTVQKRTGDFLHIIGCGNKQDLRKILGDLHIMIVESHVLFRIQYFQKGGRNIPSVVAACLVDLVKKHQGIAYPGLLQGCRDPSRHGAHISLPVAADLRFVPDAAQADPHILLMQGFRYGFRDRSLAGTRRSHQAEDRRFSS